jgi:cell division protease FtsH
MDRDVRAIVEALYERVRDAIERHRSALEALADALLDRETLEGSEALAILHAHGISTEDPMRRRAVDERLRGGRRPGSLRAERRAPDLL